MKQNTKNRKRRLTAAEKKIVAAAGMEPKWYLYDWEDEDTIHLYPRYPHGVRAVVLKNPTNL